VRAATIRLQYTLYVWLRLDFMFSQSFHRSARIIRLSVFVFSLSLWFVPIINAQNATPTPIIHIVTSGDTLSRIAQFYRVRVDDLVIANELPNINTIYVGQRLIIPESPTATLAPTMSLSSTTVTLTDSATLTPANTPAPTDTLSSITGGSLVNNTPTTISIQTNPFFVPVSTIVLATPVTPSATPTMTLTPVPPTPMPPSTVNGLSFDQFLIMDDAVRAHIREIYAVGQSLGRNPRAFSKIGDSTIENPFFMDRFDSAPFNLGDYAYLQSVIGYYQGSFARNSVAVRVGLHSWSVLDPMWADPYTCNGGEHLLACEIRLHNPSIMFIRLGSNDAGVPNLVDRNLRAIVDFCILNGIIPIIGTKADRFDGANNTNNEIIRQIADDFQILLWDFDLLAATIPGRGLLGDQVHMTTFYAHDWTLPGALQTGHGVHSLTGLMALDAVMDALGVTP